MLQSTSHIRMTDRVKLFPKSVQGRNRFYPTGMASKNVWFLEVLPVRRKRNKQAKASHILPPFQFYHPQTLTFVTQYDSFHSKTHLGTKLQPQNTDNQY